MKDKHTPTSFGRKESTKFVRCRPTQRVGSNMEGVDVTIFYSTDASEWNNYLMWCFQELQAASSSSSTMVSEQDDVPLPPHRCNQQSLHVRQQCVDNLVLPLTMAMIGFYRRAKVQIVILSPDFLEFIVKNAKWCLGNVFEASRVLCLMCGVSESEVTAQHRANLVTFDAWKKMTVIEDDQEFVMSLITTALTTIQNYSTERLVREVSKAFHLYPSKAREGNPEVIVQLKSPVLEGQVVSLTLETENESVPIDVKCPNPYTLRFTVPDRFFGYSQYVHVQIKCGSESLGVRPLKCEAKMNELHQLLETIFNPFEFMCQTLGLSSSMLENVDRILVESFRKNFPKSGFTLFDFDKDTCRRRVASELPTLLHFAAKMGLEEVCTALLDCPGAAAACRIRNVNGLGPVDLAQLEGHSCLANMIDNFMKLSETAQMYIYMKSVTEGGCNVDYENLRTAFTQSIEEVGTLVSPFIASDQGTGSLGQLPGHQEEQSAPTDVDDTKCGQSVTEDSKKSNAASSVPYSKSQQQLLQLLEDFKSDKYTIDEAESMFNCWQLRQKSQLSFKEKQEQLMAMRQRYDRVQKRCQQEAGKKSALERFRTFLVRNMKSSSGHHSTSKTSNNVQVRSKINEESTSVDPQVTSSSSAGGQSVASNGRRPYSNISNVSSRSSSSLSNRSSTLSVMSASSATDSGAQSDIGEETHVYEPTLMQQSNTPLLPRSIENLQYMYAPSNNNPPTTIRNNHTATVASSSSPSSSSLPQNVSSSVTAPPALATKPFTSSCRGRNPMPFPRIIPSSGSIRSAGQNQKPQAPTSSSCISIPATLDRTVDECSARPLQLPLATNLDNERTSNSSMSSLASSSSPIRDGYLCMDTTTSMGRRRSKSPSAPTPVLLPSDPDYSNVLYGPNGVYMDMSCQAGVAKESRAVNVSSSPSPISVRSTPPSIHHQYVNNLVGMMSSDSDFSDRCDSVPDFPPPAPPMTILNQTRPKLPPPLPPRNRVGLMTNGAK